MSRTSMVIDARTVELLHTTLMMLIRGGQQGRLASTSHGICYNWKRVLQRNFAGVWYDQTYLMVAALQSSWPQTTGCGDCPIAEDRDWGMWEGPNLVARMDLMRHMLAKLEAMMQRKVSYNVAVVA